MIDTHVHFWKYDAVRDSWIDEHMEVLKRDFMPYDLAPRLRENNIDGCIAVQADSSEEETTFLLKLSEKYDFIKAVTGWVDLCSPDINNRLEQRVSHHKFRGLRHIVQAEPDPGFMLRSDFQNGIKCLGQLGLTYDILIYAHQLDAAIALADKFPEQRFVVDHIAKPAIKENIIVPWKEKIRRLAKHPNVYCKVSGLVTEADWKSWEAGAIEPYLDVVFEAFGEKRVFYGSDWPVCLLAASYKEVLNLTKNYCERHHLNPDLVFSENAIRFYGL